MVSYFGAGFLVCLLLPNVIAAALKKVNSKNAFDDKLLLAAEQAGRYGAMLFLVLELPKLTIGFLSQALKISYIAVGSSLCAAYIIMFFVLLNKKGLFKAVVLSVLPTLIFLSCGVLSLNIPLIVFAAIFGGAHITVSVKNAKAEHENT